MLEIKGPNLFKGYWRQPEKTAEEMRPDGFFITGDIATMAADGRVAIVGRAKDLIIAGGLNIYPKEIELAIDAVPGVGESAVIGVPHPDLGEAVVAVVVRTDPALDEAALLAGVADLARFKQPRRILFADALPRNAMGKVQKAALREAHKDLFARLALLVAADPPGPAAIAKHAEIVRAAPAPRVEPDDHVRRHWHRRCRASAYRGRPGLGDDRRIRALPVVKLLVAQATAAPARRPSRRRGRRPATDAALASG